MKKYAASWSTSLIVLSAIITLICVGVAIVLAWDGLLWVAALPAAIVFWGILFTIRGYSVTTDNLLVHRLFWATRVPLAGLRSATAEHR